MPLTFNKDHRRQLTPQDFERSWIPARLRVASLERIPKNVPYRADLVRYTDGIDKYIKEGTGIVFGGEHGGGKSASSIIVAKEVLARGGSVLFLEENLLIEAVLTKRNFDEDYTILERAETVDLFILDDVGLSPKSENLHLTETLVKYRIHRRKANIITTNLRKADFEVRYKTIADALRESSIPIICEGTSWRDQLEKDLHSEFK